jgi:hypothetical protein
MNNYFNYAKLSEIADNIPPFRGTNRYPVENRRHTYKYFTIGTDTDGQRMFNIGYYHEHEKESITNEEYAEILAKTKSKRALNKLHQEDEWDEVNKRYNPTGNYYRYLKNDRILAIVRADNTIEFTDAYYGQGDRHFLSGDGWTTKGYVSTSVRHGGMTYFLSNTRRQHGLPIFEGMRFNMTTLELHPDSKYIFKRRVVNRKKVKEAFKKYEQPFTLARTMLGAMSTEVFKDDISNVLGEHLSDEAAQNNWISQSDVEKAIGIADSIILDKPLDAIYLYIKSMGVRFYSNDKPIEAFQRVQHKLKNHLYYINDTFDYEEYDHTQALPTSSWDMDLIVNGKIIKR